MIKKFLLACLFAISFSFTSCAIGGEQDGIYIGTEYRTRSYVDFDVVVRYGTPYYLDGALQYYIYNGLYYYPFYHNNYWYVRVYQKPRLHTHFVPNRYDYRFKSGRYPGFNKPKLTPAPSPRRATPQQPNRVSPQVPRQNRPNSSGRTPRSGSGRR